MLDVKRLRGSQQRARIARVLQALQHQKRSRVDSPQAGATTAGSSKVAAIPCGATVSTALANASALSTTHSRSLHTNQRRVRHHRLAAFAQEDSVELHTGPRRLGNERDPLNAHHVAGRASRFH